MANNMNQHIKRGQSRANRSPHETINPNNCKKESSSQPSGSEETTFYIANMDCPMEEALIRKKLAGLAGVDSLKFNLMNRTLKVEHRLPTTEPIVAALDAIDMHPEASRERQIKMEDHLPWKKLLYGGIIAALSEICELLETFRPIETLPDSWYTMFNAGSLVLAIAAILLAGLSTYKKGWIAISNFNLNINALMAVAVTGAVLIGQFPEAAMVMVLFNVSETIEAKALDKTRGTIKELLSLMPNVATIQTADGLWRSVDVENIPVGATARVRPGEKIALDGIVTSGQSTVNQAPITGESMPVDKKAGDVVYAGSINETGAFEYRTTALAADTTVARIIRAVESAQATRAPIQRFIDIFAKYYTPSILLIAFLYALLPPLLFGLSWQSHIYTGLVLLVIGCPCALVISTPVTIVSGMAAAAKSGIIIKGGIFLEQGRKLRRIAFDKTGTVTYGKPKLTDFILLDNIADKKDIKRIAESLASMSDHPVSAAISQDLEKPLPIKDFQALPGEGISGVIEDEKWFLGKYKREKDIPTEIAMNIEELEKQGKTVIYLANGTEIAAIFAVADTARPNAADTIKQLNKMGIQTILLTGDNEHTARSIALSTGVSEFQANLLPQDKLDILRSLKKDGKSVGMVGDGINDAPALAEADIGFAMARNGTDTAIESADVALMDDDLRKVPKFIKLSHIACRILAENIAIALGIKLLFFILAIFGYVNMWMAVFADVGAALIVVGNGLRVMRK